MTLAVIPMSAQTARLIYTDCHVKIMELIPAADYLPADVERNDRALGVMHMYRNDIVNGAGNETGIQYNINKTFYGKTRR